MATRGRKRGLTPLQERFCHEFAVDMKATLAARRAGYAPKEAARRACELLKKPHVLELVEKLKAKQYRRMDIKADNVLLELSRIGFVDPGGLFDLHGVLLPFNEIPEDIRRAISSVEVQTVYSGSGVNRTEVGRAMKIRFWSKVEALETLGKHFKLWVDRLEISGRIDVAEALRKARERRVQRALAQTAPKPPEGTTS